MERVKLESARHFERVAKDLKGKNVVIEIKRIEDSKALFRATCELLGIEAKENKAKDEKKKAFWNLVEAMLSKHNLSVKDVSPMLLFNGLKKYVKENQDLVDVVRDIEKKITIEASKYLHKPR